MKKGQTIALTVSIVCALAVMVVGVIMIFSQPERNAPETNDESTVATTPQERESGPAQEDTLPENTELSEEVKQPPTDLPSKVEILPGKEKDETEGEEEKAEAEEGEQEEGEQEEEGVKFPCTIPGYKLALEKIAPYDGLFVEDGTNVQGQQVAMILVKNNGDYPIEYAQIAVYYGETQLTFAISALPVGEKLVVQEQMAQRLPQGVVTKVTALVVQQAEMDLSEDKIRVTDLGEGRLKIENLTDTAFSSVRVFYKYHMPEEDVFVGGITFTVNIYRLGAKGSTIIQPAHYSSTTGRVVMVRTYE